jgi:hypothetical protein
MMQPYFRTQLYMGKFVDDMHLCLYVLTHECLIMGYQQYHQNIIFLVSDH